MKRVRKTFRIPSLVAQASASDLASILETAPGVEEYDIDHVNHSVTLLLTEEDAEPDVIKRLDDGGFTVEED